jgi:hypothetical protein
MSHASKRGLGILEYVIGKLHKLEPCGGRASSSVRTLEQNDAEPIFKVANPKAESRLPNTHGFDRLPQAAALRRDHRQSEISKLE